MGAVFGQPLLFFREKAKSVNYVRMMNNFVKNSNLLIIMCELFNIKKFFDSKLYLPCGSDYIL